MSYNNTANNEDQSLTVLDYLHGKVADFTVSENAIISVMIDRNVSPRAMYDDVEDRQRKLCYADLLKYIYISPNMTKSYSQTNGNWSQKEGATQLSLEDKKKILAEMKRLYAACGETGSIPASRPAIVMNAHGMRTYPRRRR